MGAIVEHVDAQLRAAGVAQGPRVHFVAHSLGGLVARAYLAEHRPPNLGRVVLLAPPNRGSPVIDRLRAAGVSVTPIGPTGRALGAGARDLPALLPPPDYPVGILAGSADMLVPVESARLEGMADFMVLDSGHAWMRNNSEAADQTIHFLREGRFRR
jgi:pimeloyl-ACP methyl ester carboxylesterase